MLVKSGSGTLVCLVGGVLCRSPKKVTDLLSQRKWKYEVAKVAKK